MRRIFGFLIFPLILLAIDVYVFQAVKTVVRDSSETTRRITYIIYWSLTVITFLSIFSNLFVNFKDWPNLLRNIVLGTIAISYSTKIFVLPFLLVDDVQRIVRWVYSFFAYGNDGPRNISRAKFLSQAGLLVATFPLAAGLWGVLKGAHNYTIHRIRIPLANLPDAFNGLKIVQLSDIHAGSFASLDPIKRAVEIINKEQADLIFFTGDLVNNEASEVLPYVPIFAQMQAKLGKFSVFGNHDYGDYVEWENRAAKQANQDRLKQAHAEMGWKLLWDEHAYVEKDGQRIGLIGIQNCSARGFHTYGNLDKACEKCDAPVKLLLSHDPSYWDHKIRQFDDIDVTFAGHTHGAQLGVEIGKFRWSPAQYMYEQWAGLYQKGKQYIYVNRGFGYIGFPGRVGILPEITVVELVKG